MVLFVLSWSVIIALIGVNAQEFWQRNSVPYRGSLSFITITPSGNGFAMINAGIFGVLLSIIAVIENEEETVAVPTTPLTAHNYSNPFNSSTIICFIITQTLAKFVTNLSVNNIQGKKNIRLIDERFPAGNYLTH
jgi:hypothetical protein